MWKGSASFLFKEEIVTVKAYEEGALWVTKIQDSAIFKTDSQSWNSKIFDLGFLDFFWSPNLIYYFKTEIMIYFFIFNFESWLCGISELSSMFWIFLLSYLEFYGHQSITDWQFLRLKANFLQRVMFWHFSEQIVNKLPLKVEVGYMFYNDWKFQTYFKSTISFK